MNSCPILYMQIKKKPQRRNCTSELTLIKKKKKPDRQGKLVKRCQLLLKLGDKYFVVLEFFKDKHIICVNTSPSVITRGHMGDANLWPSVNYISLPIFENSFNFNRSLSEISKAQVTWMQALWLKAADSQFNLNKMYKEHAEERRRSRSLPRPRCEIGGNFLHALWWANGLQEKKGNKSTHIS